jgi:hypothetical protein
MSTDTRVLSDPELFVSMSTVFKLYYLIILIEEIINISRFGLKILSPISRELEAPSASAAPVLSPVWS